MDSGSEEESVLDVGEEQLFEEDLEVDEFAETLKLIESNAKKLTSNCWTRSARLVVEGAKHFQCPDCPKVCKSKGGLTRHRRSKHPDKEELTVATINIPPINMEIIAKIILKLSRNCEKKTFIQRKFSTLYPN
ncbi:Zinc finger, C2H2 type family [Paramuricea clavata]|uniref:Zinc finger, C2H2 type family (Macronuclear) n=1 Tax=Paramuricea clavata TaxID=317549 RepID=A0A6S7H3U8_PARCT|nr:Zinc finger, C2H2 type family [Paramuricea clavata]